MVELNQYYKKKVEAQSFVRSAIQNSKKVEKSKLYLYVSEHYGFSELFVNKYLELLEQNGIVKLNKEMVVFVSG